MSLTDNEWAEFRRTSADERGYPTAALVAAFSDTLALWAESSDFTINMTMLNRGDDIPGIMRTVGDFTMSSLLGLIRDERAPFFSALVQRNHSYGRILNIEASPESPC